VGTNQGTISDGGWGHALSGRDRRHAVGTSPKLLRALREREFERLGGAQTVQVNVRVVAATSQDLEQLVSKKLFRVDLFYRLNVIPICLPPLRERVQDILPLTEFFVAKCAARLNKPIDLIPDEVVAVLKAHDLPGKIREPQNSVEPGDEQDPRDQSGNILYDRGVSLLETWGAMENLVDRGKCRAIGLSDISLNELLPIYESARIKPAVVQVEAHPYLPETELLEFCKERDVVFLAFAPLGYGMKPGPLEDPVISAIAARIGKTPAQVLLAWAVQRGTALLTTPRTAARARENLNISALPEDALDEINRIQTRQRFNEVVKTGSPGFIPQGR